MENGFIEFVKEKAGAIIIVALLLVGVGVVVVATREDPNDPRQQFAQCLTDKGVKMFGAFWCPHCQAQKRLFGSSFKKVSYIECGVPGNTSGQTQACQDAKIQTYPTWEFADGSRKSGELTFAELATASSCEWKGNQ